MKISPADKAFADCIKYAANNVCDWCGIQRERMECSHIYGRRHRTIRWCKDNAVCKCHSCHRRWHENPIEGRNWFIDKYGQGLDDLLLEKKNSRIKVSKLEEKDIAKHYRQQLKLMKESDSREFESWQ